MNWKRKIKKTSRCISLMIAWMMCGGFALATDPTPTATPQCILRVPTDFSSIQQALNHAPSHSLILVNPGVYLENILWPQTPDLRLAPASVPGSVTIDGGFRGRVILMMNVPEPGASLFGLRITHGRHSDGGAGLRIENSSVVMMGCTVYDNIADESSGMLYRPGIDCRNSHLYMIGSTVHDHFASGSEAAGVVVSGSESEAHFEGCVFRDNMQILSDGAGALAVMDGSCRIQNCEFHSNTGGSGAAVRLETTAVMDYCLVTGSSVPSSGAAIQLMHDDVRIQFCTIADNACTGIGMQGFGTILGSIITSNEIGLESDGFAILERNDVYGNAQDYVGIEPGLTDISQDPLFSAGTRGHFYLSQLAAGQSQNSPCLDAADPAWSVDGTTRTDHVLDTAAPDIGFHRNLTIASPVPTITPTSSTPVPTSTPFVTATPTAPPITMTPVSGLIRVPEDYSNIQMAIDASSNGGIVLINDGIYSGVGNRDIKFRGKQITVRSLNGPDSTVIDCEGTYTDMHRGFLFDQNEASTSVLDGIRMQNGFSVEGAGILIRSGAYPVVRNCQIVHCDATSYGGGIRAYNSHFTLINTEIRDCYASDGGGGIALFGGESLQPLLFRSHFIDNAAGMEQGGGVFIQDNSEPIITSCEFEYNAGIALVMDSGINSKIILGNTLFSENCGGVYIKRGRAEIINCTFAGNDSYAVRGDRGRKNVYLLRSSLFNEGLIDVTQADYCNTSASVVGIRNYDADPLFLPGPMGEFYISYNIAENGVSPNLNTGGVAVWTVNFEGPFGYAISLGNLTTAVTETLDDRFADVGYHHHPSNESPTPTPNPPGRPIIEDVLGSTEHFETGKEIVFILSAKVTHPEGASRVQTVELYLENFPTSIELFDDGTHGDTVPNDNRYNRELRMPAYSVPPRQYLMYVVAFDTYGQPSDSVPYVISVENPDKVTDPVIKGRHLWYSLVKSGEDNVGFIWILADVANSDASGEISRVELMYEGLPTGVELVDDGLHNDLDAGDGLYGVFMLYQGSEISGPIEIQFDIQAISDNGSRSSTWPIAWKAQ